MKIILIILVYVIIALVELPALILKKQKRELVFFCILMVLALIEAIIFSTNQEMPSLASIIKKILDPILNLKI